MRPDKKLEPGYQGISYFMLKCLYFTAVDDKKALTIQGH